MEFQSPGIEFASSVSAVSEIRGKKRLIGYVSCQAMVSCAFNGLGLALVIPCVQSLVADYHPSEARGQAFGLMGLTSSFGEGHLTASP